MPRGVPGSKKPIRKFPNPRYEGCKDHLRPPIKEPNAAEAAAFHNRPPEPAPIYTSEHSPEKIESRPLPYGTDAMPTYLLDNAVAVTAGDPVAPQAMKPVKVATDGSGEKCPLCGHTQHPVPVFLGPVAMNICGQCGMHYPQG